MQIIVKVSSSNSSRKPIQDVLVCSLFVPWIRFSDSPLLLKCDFFSRQVTFFKSILLSPPVSAEKQNHHSPRRCLSASDRLDIFAVKEGMTETPFAPENVKGKGHT